VVRTLVGMESGAGLDPGSTCALKFKKGSSESGTNMSWVILNEELPHGHVSQRIKLT
jgi:hypothetical protein